MQNINRIYARTNADNVVVKIFSEVFCQPLASDYLIDATNTDRQGANKYAVLDDNGMYNYCIVNGKLTIRDKTAELQNNQILNLRQQRQTECFQVINRGQLWYNTLTAVQIQELSVWYQGWLDVTKSRVVPARPSWLK